MKKSLKVLVPIDFSAHSLNTLRFAASLKDFFDPALVLLHVVPTGEVETFASLGGEPGSGLTQRIEASAAELEREAGAFRKEHPEIPVEIRVVSGVPFKEICRFADEENVRLVVIGTHGRTGLSHLLIDSTAERVVQHTSCPVLSVKPRVL